MADPGHGGGKVQQVHTFATKLAKHSVKERDTTVICPPICHPPGSAAEYIIQLKL